MTAVPMDLNWDPPRYVVRAVSRPPLRAVRHWEVYDRLGQQIKLTGGYEECLKYAQKANQQLSLI